MNKALPLFLNCFWVLLSISTIILVNERYELSIKAMSYFGETKKNSMIGIRYTLKEVKKDWNMNKKIFCFILSIWILFFVCGISLEVSSSIIYKSNDIGSDFGMNNN